MPAQVEFNHRAFERLQVLSSAGVKRAPRGTLAVFVVRPGGREVASIG